MDVSQLNRSRVNESRVNESRLNCSVLNASGLQWVKKNMVEDEPSYELDTSLVDAWIFSGLRNEDAPDSIVGEKGIPLTCHNFAWNEEGSGFKDGALHFDKVDDYLINEEMPLLTDFTVIVRRKCMGDAGALLYKGEGKTFNTGGSGAFQLEVLYKSGNDILNFLFKKAIFVEGKGQITTKDEAVSFTPTSVYKGLEYEQNFESIPKEDGPVLKINSPLYGNNYYQITLKYLALYNKTLSESEIQSEIKKLERIWSNRLNSN